MIFDEDAILLSLFERFSDEAEEEDLAKAIIKYCQQGTDMHRPDSISTSKVEEDEMDSATSPSDSAIDLKKKKRLN
jgi:hypothetical protein